MLVFITATVYLIFGTCLADNAFNCASNGAVAFVARKYDLAIECFSKAIQLNTNYAEAYFGRGWAYYEKKEFSNALIDLNESIRIHPKAETYLQRGAVFAVANSLDKAICDFTEAIKLKPTFAEAYINRGHMFACKGDYINAITDCSAALELNPNQANSCSAYHYRACAFYHKGDFDKAMSDFNSSIKINPRDAEVLASRGEVLAEIGDFTNAIADCERAIVIDTNYYSLNNLAWFLSISPEKSLRNGRRAVELAQKACELTSWKELHSLGTLAAAYAETGDFAAAVKWQKKSIECYPAGSDLKDAQKLLRYYELKKPYRFEQVTPTYKGSMPTQDLLAPSHQK